MAGLRVTLLEGFEARLASGPTLDLPTKKAKALPALPRRWTRSVPSDVGTQAKSSRRSL